MYKFSRCHVIVFIVFFFPMTVFCKIRPVSTKIHLGIARTNFGKIGDLSVKSAINSAKLAEFRDSRFRLFLHRLHCISTEFRRFLPNFSKTGGIAMTRISSVRRTFEHCLHVVGPRPLALLLCRQHQAMEMKGPS
jgi:hypothetical protein